MVEIKKYRNYIIIIKDGDAIVANENFKLKKQIIDALLKFSIRRTFLDEIIKGEYVEYIECKINFDETFLKLKENGVNYRIHLLLYEYTFRILFVSEGYINNKFIITTFIANPFDASDMIMHQYHLIGYRRSYFHALQEILSDIQIQEGYTIIEKAFIQKEIAEKIEEEIRKRENERKI